MSNSSSVLQVRKNSEIFNVPIARGKSAYEHALNGGLEIYSEEEFNHLMANLVFVDSGLGKSKYYKLDIGTEEPDENTDENTITIVLR